MMSKRKRERITGEPSGLFTFPSKKGIGEYWRTSHLVMSCMGVQDFAILAANHDCYLRHKNNLYKQGTFWLSVRDCKTITGFNKNEQKESYSNIYELSLLIPSNIPGPKNVITKWINIPSASIWSWIIYRHSEALVEEYKEKNGEHIPRMLRLEALKEFYKETLKNKRRKTLLRRFFEEMKDCTAKEIKSGKHDERLESFYDELIGRKHKKSKKVRNETKEWTDKDGVKRGRD